MNLSNLGQSALMFCVLCVAVLYAWDPVSMRREHLWFKMLAVTLGVFLGAMIIYCIEHMRGKL